MRDSGKVGNEQGRRRKREGAGGKEGEITDRKGEGEEGKREIGGKREEGEIGRGRER